MTTTVAKGPKNQLVATTKKKAKKPSVIEAGRRVKDELKEGATSSSNGKPTTFQQVYEQAVKVQHERAAGKVAVVHALDSKPGKVTTLPWDSIERHPANYRQHFDKDDIAELWSSINSMGLKDALLVRPHPTKKNRYQLVDGERRHRAIEQSPKDHPIRQAVKVEIRELTDVQVRAIMAVTRAQSRDLLPSELAAAYAGLLKDHGATDRVAELVGQKPRKVQDILRIMKLPEFARQAIDEGKIKPGTMARVARIPGKENRTIAATLVLAGRSWWNSRDRLPKIGEDDTPLSDRRVVELIQDNFQGDLGGAPFDWKKPLPMFKEQPDCQTCPKRAGNDAEAKDDGVRADMCLDLECLERKSQCHHDARLAEAKKEGQTVMSATEAKKVLSPYGQCTPVYNSAYLDLDDETHESGYKKYRDVIKDLDPKKVVLAQDKEGRVHELVKRKEVKITRPKSESQSRTISEAEKKAQAKRKEEQELESAVDHAILAQINAKGLELHKEMGSGAPEKAEGKAIEILRLVCREMFSSGSTDGIFGRRGLSLSEAVDRVEKEIEDATSQEVWGLLPELYFDSIYADADKKKLLEILGIDAKAIEKQVKETLAKPKLAVTKSVGKLHLSLVKDFPVCASLVPASKPLCATPPFDTLGEVIDLAERQTASADHKGKLIIALSTRFKNPKDAENGAEAILNHLYPGRKTPTSATEKGNA
jgi:ParB/RepB/Spo0J family partition protein